MCTTLVIHDHHYVIPADAGIQTGRADGDHRFRIILRQDYHHINVSQFPQRKVRTYRMQYHHVQSDI